MFPQKRSASEKNQCMFNFKWTSFLTLACAFLATACASATTSTPTIVLATVEPSKPVRSVSQATLVPETTRVTEPNAAPTASPIPPTVSNVTRVATATATLRPEPTATPLNPLTIPALRARDFPGSELVIEQTLTPGANYQRYIASHLSDGLKIYGLLTVPNGEKPATGWPVILFNHGYISPSEYRTTERYVAYQDAIARAGYITFKSDYRGHGNSEGTPSGHFAPGYTIDVLNAMGSLKKFADADPNRIGMWGHSLGGEIVLRAMVISKDIKAGVSWAGTVAPPSEQLGMWGGGSGGGANVPHGAPRAPSDLTQQYGTPEENPEFWASLASTSYLTELSGPLQVQHGTADPEVPLSFSQVLYAEILKAGKIAELYTYPGDNHNLSNNFNLAMQRTVAFFDKYVKGQP